MPLVGVGLADWRVGLVSLADHACQPAFVSFWGPLVVAHQHVGDLGAGEHIERGNAVSQLVCPTFGRQVRLETPLIRLTLTSAIAAMVWPMDPTADERVDLGNL